MPIQPGTIRPINPATTRKSPPKVAIFLIILSFNGRGLWIPIPRDEPPGRGYDELSRVKQLAENFQLHNLLRKEAKGMRTGVAPVVPKPIAIQPIRLPSWTVIHGSADSIKNPTIGFGIKPHRKFLRCADGLDETLMIWNHTMGFFGPRFIRRLPSS
jgi:hypothetical protein